MSFLGRPGREEIAAALIAAVVLIGGAALWARSDRATADCCGPREGLKLDAPIAVDRDLHTDTLPNGVRYFVRANEAPSQRAELRLVVNVGSAFESENQRGLAHAVEHMAFRGSRRFPKRAMLDYVQSIGMRAGEHFNAGTSRDETVYQLTVPTDRIGALEQGIAILADMAHDASFDPEEARKEAGVVFEEWRSSRVAAERLVEQRDALLLAGSPYGVRHVIGDTAVLRRFDVAEMLRFYKEWYRPELMAIVVVGDFDVRAVERLVKKHFGAIPASAERRDRPVLAVKPPMGFRAATITDAEATQSRLALWFPRVARSRRTVADHRQELVDELWRDILDARLERAAEAPGSPIVAPDIAWRGAVRLLDAEVVSGEIDEARTLEALDVLVGEVVSFSQRGATQQELTKHRDALFRRVERANAYLDETEDLVADYVNEFLTGSVALDREAAFALARDLLPGIRLADIIATSRRASLDSGAILFATAPTHADLANVSADAMIARARIVAARSTAQTATTTDTISLLPALPTSGRIISEKPITGTGVTEWTLGNGMRVIIKPTTFSDNHIEFRLVGPGGASLATDADYPSAYSADAIVQAMGLGPVNAAQLDRIIAASSLTVSPTVYDDAVEVSGHAAPRDLKLLFELLHLYFTAPRADAAAFTRYHARAISSAVRRERNPGARFADSIAAITGGHHPRAATRGRRFVSAIRMPAALAFWKQRTANAAGFTLVMSGDFTFDDLRTPVARYLGSLPGGTVERPRDDGIRFPAGATTRTIIAGPGPRARAQIVLSGPIENTFDAAMALESASAVAELALDEELRETLGGTYGVSVSSSISRSMPRTYSIAIRFEAAPERVDSLASAALAQLSRLSTTGPTKREADAVKAATVRDFEQRLVENSYWADAMSHWSRMGWPIAGIAAQKDDAERMTSASLRNACAQYLSARQYVRVTMRPADGDAAR